MTENKKTDVWTLAEIDCDEGNSKNETSITSSVFHDMIRRGRELERQVTAAVALGDRLMKEATECDEAGTAVDVLEGAIRRAVASRIYTACKEPTP